jgi:hypothetical protein
LKRVSWNRLTSGVKPSYQVMSKEQESKTQESVLASRLQNITMDLEMLENSQKRLEENKAKLVLKLVHTRESLLGLSEQDE